MYNVSDSYKTFIKKPSRSFECRITLGNRVFNNSDIIQIVPTVVQPSDRFSIGNTVSQSIDITLKNDGAAYASVGEIKVEIGLKINNSIEYIPFGTFNIDDVSKTDYTVKLTCYDNMVKFETGYFSKLGNTPTLQEVVNELATITGVEFTGTIPNYTVTKLEGYTCREVLAYVASVCGGNAYITRDNKFTIIYPHEVDCTITADNYFSTGYKLEDQAYKIGMITCQNKSNSDNDSSESDNYDSVNDKNTISVGSLSSDSMELTFENPWVTQSILNDIYNKLKNFSYLGYTLKWQGDLSLDPLDIITLVDKNNVTRKALVYANKLTYNGGLSAETSAKGETKNSNSFSASGSANKNIERLSVKLLIAEKAIINKANIADLQANSARIDKLDANVATINTALIDYANISNATIADLVATKATVSDLSVSVANIDSALINKANVADLTAAKATISNLSTDVANIKTLVNGNLTSANIQSLVLTSSKVTVDNGFIKNAMIESLDVTKINAGTLNTNKISVSSADGGLVIAGATQQFKDKNGKVRIQMGQDAQGNFNFILVAGDGTTTLIDGTGVKANAIADKLIKTNMVADSAIGSQQINYSSFVTGFNASTNTNFIKASKVAIDLTGQTLDIAFNNMNTTVTSVQTTANTAKSTADTASSNASNAVSTANSANTSASTALNNANSALDTANTAKTTATTASTNASNAVNTANSANSTANTANTNASTAVNTANTALSTVNNLQVGGRNLIRLAYIVNRGCSSFTYDSGSNTWICVAPKGSTSWGYGFYISSGGKIPVERGKTLLISLEVNPSVDCTWNADVNNSYTGNTTGGNDNDDTTKRQNSSRTLLANTWTKCWFSYTAKSDASYDLFDASSNWGIITSSNDISFKFRNVKGEYGNTPTDWTPAPEDVDQAITSVKTVTETNTTSISAIQGQISTLISNTTITATDGTTTQLKDAYNGTVNTINSMKTSIGELTTDIDANTKDITSVTSRTSTIETNLSSISATLSSTKSTVDTHTTQISTANTNITTALNNASSAVNTANTANTTANSAKTTATTASTNASNAVTTANSAISNASTALTNSNTAISTANTASTNASNAVSTANKASTDVSTLTTTVTNTVSRVSSLELTTSGLTTRVGNTETAISNLSIGGRNLWLRTKEYDVVNDTRWVDNNGGSRISSYTVSTSINGFGVIRIATWWTDLSQRVTLEANTNYVLSAWIKSESDTALASINAYVNSGSTVISQNFTQNQAISTTWTRYCFVFNSGTLTTSTCRFESSNNNAYLIYGLKLEKGNKPTDWTPAPEDVDNSIASVKDYATQTVNSNVSTINQTTDSIKASVQSLQSSVSTINTTLGNKADSSAVTSITNRVSTLETGVNGINASITTLNSNVSSVTTTANAAKSAIDNLQVGGRNLLLNSDLRNGLNSWGGSNSSTITKVTTAPDSISFPIGVTSCIKNAVSSTSQTNGYTVQTVTLLANTKYTLSFWVYIPSSTTGTASISVWYDNSGWKTIGNIVVSERGKWVRKSYTFTTNSTYTTTIVGFGLGGSSTGNCSYLALGKLEVGNTDTDWTPAPEDIDSQITTVNSSVSSLQSSVSVLQNQIALKVEQSNIDSAVSTLNGKITAQNTTISSLQSQINVQAGQISSKVEQTTFNSYISNVNLIQNGDFSYGVVPGSTTAPTHWNLWGSACVYAGQGQTGYNMPRTLYIAHPITSTCGMYTENLNLSTNTTYTISFALGKEGSITSATAAMEYYDSNGNSTGYSVFNYDFSKSDTIQSFTFTTPQSFGRVIFAHNATSTSSSGGYLTRLGYVKLEKGSIATGWGLTDNIGTIVTQSPTQVMTAFNNISKYFQVSADGAKFGDLLTGAYTKMSQNGLEHIDNYGATPYFYLSYTGQGSASVAVGGYKTTLTINLPSDFVNRLNGKIPKGIASVSNAYPNGDTFAGGVSITSITATTMTLDIVCFSDQLYDVTKGLVYNQHRGGMVYFTYILIA
ncbi:beta strand repeat-containing protein [Clostridium beijerinckii]|uniref:Nucleic acid-binding Zn-ribbon protein n=1 Tax=Clostridium beijerinckii TaxID=1520 RepID=A0AAX0AYC3_CLOBE|nr:carbohydrate binding domain-containing protein [Clostridium beijerinckii]NRT88097.1 putative nucleic acid-binding Zn-ribbon protein [Clostridium beijerinckii]NYC73525.1 putative nucleic acid-binding Zn-ribbon protein [Clostridium beijerinckii]